VSIINKRADWDYEGSLGVKIPQQFYEIGDYSLYEMNLKAQDRQQGNNKFVGESWREEDKRERERERLWKKGFGEETGRAGETIHYVSCHTS
jgi:hypothetical protein